MEELTSVAKKLLLGVLEATLDRVASVYISHEVSFSAVVHGSKDKPVVEFVVDLLPKATSVEIWEKVIGVVPVLRKTLEKEGYEYIRVEPEMGFIEIHASHPKKPPVHFLVQPLSGGRVRVDVIVNV